MGLGWTGRTLEPPSKLAHLGAQVHKIAADHKSAAAINDHAMCIGPLGDKRYATTRNGALSTPG